MRALVTGAGGFIGGHLVQSLVSKGFTVKAVDIKPMGAWYQKSKFDVENVQADLRILSCAEAAVSDVDVVYNLAADMGGMGFIENNKALCMITSLINTHLLLASRDSKVNKFFFASSACVYSSWHQNSSDLSVSLSEQDAYPADPEDGYGWEKLFGERMCRHFSEDFGLDVRIARFHNVYGPNGTWDGGREKAPAAACRKMAEFASGLSKEVEIWGDGQQVRSFTYIDDCVDGILRLMESNFQQPINLGSSESVTISQLYRICEEIAGVKSVDYKFDPSAPQGVRGRSSDNTLIKQVLDWEPNVPLSIGLRNTYDWVLSELNQKLVKGL